MKISLVSPSADRLIKHGVKTRELKATRIFVFNMQVGDAITLPFPILGPVILIKRRWLVFDDDDELEDSVKIKMLRHEFCHVRQIQDWGGIAYMMCASGAGCAPTGSKQSSRSVATSWPSSGVGP